MQLPNDVVQRSSATSVAVSCCLFLSSVESEWSVGLIGALLAGKKHPFLGHHRRGTRRDRNDEARGSYCQAADTTCAPKIDCLAPPQFKFLSF